jgi:hypothetical protein
MREEKGTCALVAEAPDIFFFVVQSDNLLPINSNLGETFLKAFFNHKTSAAHKKNWESGQTIRALDLDLADFAYYFPEPSCSCDIL